MEQEISNRLQTQEELLQKIYVSTEKTRKYFMWTLIITLALFFLPVLGLMLILPSFIGTMTEGYSGLF